MLSKGPYDSNKTEPEILKYWIDNKFFKPEYHPTKGLQSLAELKTDNRKPFTIINPPPNAYMRPHIGNVSGYAYQDLFLRYNRMLGKKVLGQPGKDHAGIQGEVVVDKIFQQNKGKTKQDMGREKFYKASYSHFEKLMPMVMKDEQRIGLSSDYDRNLFTLDPKVVKTILGTFLRMFKDKMVYKGVRIVNWCPKCKTALADIDTEFIDSKSPFFYFKYGFIKPEPIALSIKNKFENKTIEFEFERNRTNDGKKDLPFSYGHINIKNNLKNLPIFGIGYEKELKKGAKLTGKVIGIQMRLDKNFTLVVVNPIFKGNLQEELSKIFLFEIHYYAGAHIVIFNDYPDDKYYNNGFILATVRPETKFGDTAIAVNPKDTRYKRFVNQKFEVFTLTGKSMIRIISDDSVDMDFGTGIVKVTPAHAPEDYEIMMKWNKQNPRERIDYANIFDKEGKLYGKLVGKYQGLTSEQAREVMVKDMHEKGMLIFLEKNYTNRLRICERCKATIEHIMSSQWFIDVEKLKKPAIDAVKKGKIKIHPEYMQKKYLHWMENLHDWPVSRSLWWGYRIPVWYKGEIKEETDQKTGQIIQTINGIAVKDINDAVKKGLARIQIEKPTDSEQQIANNFKIYLIPGKHAYTNRKIYPALQKKYPDSVYIEVKNIDNPFYKDLENAFKKEFNHPSTSLMAGFRHEGSMKKATIVAHSLGTRAIIKYILENKLQIDSLILLAPACAKNPRPKNRNYEDIITNTKDYDKLDKYVKNLHIIYSNDDELMSVEEFEDFAKLFKNAQTHAEKGKKHYAGKDYDEESEALLQILSDKLDSRSEPGLPDGKAGMTLPGNSDNWVQDNDVFDTWFSSGQWVYATLEANNLLDSFYPTDIMETSYDILELWVSRMIMLSLYTQEEIPFKHVYLHGLVKAPDGQKMSKSKGNVISPDEIISKFGADALRLMYVVGNKAGAGYPVSYEKLEGYKRFLNKIWNASKFVLSNVDKSQMTNLSNEAVMVSEVEPSAKLDNKIQTCLAGLPALPTGQAGERYGKQANPKIKVTKIKQDQKLLANLQKLTEDVTKHIGNFRPGMAAELLYQNFWHDFCDIELEAYKPRLYTKDKDGKSINTSKEAQSSKLEAQKMLLYALKTYMKLLHPFIPFITEAIWQELPGEIKEAKTIMYSSWPNKY